MSSASTPWTTRGRWAVIVCVILGMCASAALGQDKSPAKLLNEDGSSPALPSRDVDVVVAESPVTMRTSTSTSTSVASAGQQDRPGLADVVKARLGEQLPKPAKTMILYAGNNTSYSSLVTDQLFGDRGAKAIRFTAKKGNELDPGAGRQSTATLTTTPSPVSAPRPPPSLAAPITAPSAAPSTALQAVEEASPWSALQGVVSDCLFGFSSTCLQRKLLVFVNRLSRLERVDLLGSYVSLVRVSEDTPPPLSERVLETRLVDDEDDSETAIESLMQHNVDAFIESHVLRFRLPSWFSSTIGSVDVGEGRDVNAVDVDLEDIVEGRQKKKKKKKKKGGKKGGGKMMKKMMKSMSKMGGMMMFGMLGKAALLAPLLGFLSTLSLKASAIALILAKIMLLRSVFSGGLGGLGGGGGGLSSLFSSFGKGGGTSQPSSGYGAPAAPSSGYGAPAAPSSSYGAPAAPSSSYGTPSFQPAPQRPSSGYGAPTAGPAPPPQFVPPSTSYGTPASSYSPPSPAYRPPSSDYGAPTGGSYFPTGNSNAGSSSGSFGSSFGGGLFGGGASSGSTAGSSAGSAGAAQSGYVGGGSHWVNKRAWDPHSLAYNAYLQEPEMYTTTEPML